MPRAGLPEPAMVSWEKFAQTLELTRAPQHKVDLIGGGFRSLLDRVLVASGHPGIGMTEQAHGNPGRDPLDQQQGRLGMPRVVRRPWRTPASRRMRCHSAESVSLRIGVPSSRAKTRP